MTADSQRWQTVCPADLADDEIRPVVAGGREMILYRSGDRYFAAQRHCLHAGADLTGAVLHAGELICGLHGWRYRADTGVQVQSPMNCLAMFAVRVEGGMVQIDPRPIRNAAPP